MKYLLVLTACLHLHAMQSQPTGSIEALIRQQEKQVTDAIVNMDTQTLKQLWAPEFTVNTPRNTIAPDRNAVIDLARRGLINYASFDRVIEDIHIDKNLVITMGHETYVSRVNLPNAKAGEAVQRRFTNIWIRRKGNWVQIGRHASVICSE